MYIDPNTGGMLFQVLAVLLAVGSGIILIFSSKIRMAWARLMRKRRGASEEPVENEPVNELDKNV
jgi:hypothetical protein